jgi:cysteine-S-conjugate beta-lyase
MKTATRCVQSNSLGDPYGAIAPPIYQTATFKQVSATEFGEYDYTRSGNPTRTILETQLAALEDGVYAAAFASGMAAITAVTHLVNSGEQVIAGNDLYGGTVRLLEQLRQRQGINVRYVDTTDLNAVREELTPSTRLLLVETPSNPLFHISDVRALAKLAHANNALLAIDNSMLSPILQRPLNLGADIVIHSATKFLCGHSDVTAGAVITNDAELHDRISFQQNAEGAGLSPFDSWLLVRSLKTLALRVERQNESAGKVAQFLAGHPAGLKVYYPGLESHPGHEIHRSQSQGDGAVVSFSTGDTELSKHIAEVTRLFTIAVSFGSFASTISLPYHMSHASIPQTLKTQLAPPTDLIRISVGIEDAHDLIEDLEQALSAGAGESRALAACVGESA